MSVEDHDAVVFDLGGVLIDWDPRYLYRQLLPDDAAVEAFLTEVGFAAWNAQLDAGRPLAGGIAAAAAEHPGRRELVEAYAARFPETLRGTVPGSVDVLHELAATGVRLLALTNWPHELFRYARERFGWLDAFAGIVVSGEERMAKPDPRIFALLASRYDLEPTRTFFTDDNPANVAAARSAGFDAEVFTSAGQLRADLTARGLLPGHPESR